MLDNNIKKKKYKTVQALVKGIKILEFLSNSIEPLSLTEISKALNLSMATVYNTINTLLELGYIEPAGKRTFRLGLKIYKIGKSALGDGNLIEIIHPFLEDIYKKTRLPTFLGFRSGFDIVTVDKVEPSYELKISTEIGGKFPIIGGAPGKAVLSQLSNDEIDRILANSKLIRFTKHTCVGKSRFKEMILKVREEGIAKSFEEYVEGICGIAVPIKIEGIDKQIVIFLIGLKSQMKKSSYPKYTKTLKEAARKIKSDLSK